MQTTYATTFTNTTNYQPMQLSVPAVPTASSVASSVASTVPAAHPLPSNIYELIGAAFNLHEANETYANTLIKTLKKYHLFPFMQVKKFKDNDNLVLLHNTYKREDVGRFKDLYDQCRSVVLDFSASINNNIVVSYANNIPDRITIDEYSNIMDQTDRFQEAYDGTMITVYNYNNTWYFGTSTCSDVNKSKFGHPTKTHGYMLNEILMSYFRNHFSDEEITSGNDDAISAKLRGLFTQNLNPAYAYEFVLVHHENIHIIDYTNKLGPEYKALYHISAKNRYTLIEEDISSQPLGQLGVLYAQYFNDIQAACNNNRFNLTYGFIVKKATDKGVRLFKISPAQVDFKEDTDPCNPNVWHNILMVYMKNRKDFQINDYIKMYAPNLQLPYDDKGRPIDPTYLIHTMISTIKDVLYNLYIATTTYNSKTNRFRMNKELDKQFPPVIRFHLALLRHRQQHDHPHSLIRPKDVYYYLCHCNNVKNIKLLITFLATSVGYNIPERSALCLTILNGLL